MRRTTHTSPAIKLTGDLLSLAAAFLFSAYLSKERVNPGQGSFRLSVRDIVVLVLLGIVWYFSARFINLYEDFQSRLFTAEFVAVLKASLIQACFAVLILFFAKDPLLNRYFMVVYFLALLLLLAAWTVGFRSILLAHRRRGVNVRSVLILGSTKAGLAFAQAVKAYPQFGYRVLGYLGDNPKGIPGEKYLGSLGRLEALLRRRDVAELVLAMPVYAYRRIDRIISACEKYTTQVRIIPDQHLSSGLKTRVTLFGRLPVVSMQLNPLGEMPNRLLKRIFDLAVSLTLFLTVFIWLWPIIALAIKIDSRGPVLFKQERWGKKDRKFICYKFRSMDWRCRQFDGNGRFLQAHQDDCRVTRVGRLLRRTSLDELPQFWNVVKGDMSIVGPRPHPIPLSLEARGKVRHYLLRRLVKPGITGWAQISGFRGPTINLSRMQQRIEHDLWYINNWSFWLDLQVILLTISLVLKGDPQAF
jgi:putative colanic acid biosynthesis UDP-glucose lipid carrier transferase